MPARDQISLGILAGGQGSRLGFADKPALEFRGQALLTRALASAGSGFDQMLLSNNGSDPRNKRPGLAWVGDLRPQATGPLAGIESLLCTATAPWLLTLPVDLRELQPWVIDALCNAADGPAAIVDGDGLQPLVALWKVSEARPAVAAALDEGQGAVHLVIRQLQMTLFDISPHRLGNLNTPRDFD